MMFERYRKKYLNSVSVNEDDTIENRIHFSDFAALCIAFFQVMAPVLIIFFIVFIFLVFLLVTFWLR